MPADGKPVTSTSAATLARLPGRPANQVRPGVFLITGLPLSDVQTTLWQLRRVIGSLDLGRRGSGRARRDAIVRLALRPLERMVDTASGCRRTAAREGRGRARGAGERLDADPGTEVGRLGAAINRMLGHVAAALTARQHSENKVRQFVADASHELRTPLTSIRGYAELTRRVGP